MTKIIGMLFVIGWLTDGYGGDRAVADEATRYAEKAKGDPFRTTVSMMPTEFEPISIGSNELQGLRWDSNSESFYGFAAGGLIFDRMVFDEAAGTLRALGGSEADPATKRALLEVLCEPGSSALRFVYEPPTRMLFMLRQLSKLDDGPRNDCTQRFAKGARSRGLEKVLEHQADKEIPETTLHRALTGFLRPTPISTVELDRINNRHIQTTTKPGRTVAPVQHPFCLDPVFATCRVVQERMAQRGRDLQTERRTFSRQVGLASGVPSYQTALANSEDPNWEANWRRYLLAMKSKMRRIPQEAIRTAEKVRAKLKKAVSEEPAFARDRGPMLEALSAPWKVASAVDEYLEGSLSLLDFVLFCGSDGLSTNGYFSGAKIVVCPAAEYATPEYLERLLAHEEGHSIDSQRFPAAYKAFLACLEKLNGHTDTASENAADWFRAKYFVEKFKEEPGSRTQLMDWIADAFESDCQQTMATVGSSRKHVERINERLRAETELKMKHASHESRLRDNFAYDPAVRALFGCEVSTAEQRACHI